MATVNLEHLVKRRRLWVVRVRVPEDAKPALGRSVFSWSTGERDHHRAAVKAAPVVAKWKAEIEAARKGTLTPLQREKRALAAAFRREVSSGGDNADLAAHFRQRYLELRDRSLSLFPDAIELLDRIGPRLPLGLITNGPADLQRMEISTLQIEGRFAHIFIEGELGRGKPDPEVFSAASTAMGLEPQQILFVGNSYGHDIRPAIEAGWKTAWIRRPSDVPPSVRGVLALPEELPTGGATPDVIVTDLRDLIKTS